MPKFTKGKWAAEWTTRDIKNGVRDATTYGWHVGIPDTDMTICVIDDQRPCDADQDHRKADAQLIADAPAMYELLQLVSDGFDGSHAQIAVAVLKCREIIARHA